VKNKELAAMLSSEHADPEAFLATWPEEEPLGAFIYNGVVYIGPAHEMDGLIGGSFIGNDETSAAIAGAIAVGAAAEVAVAMEEVKDAADQNRDG
jgi:hypothetical protein